MATGTLPVTERQPVIALVCRHALSVLLGFVPVAIAIRVFAPDRQVAIFVASVLVFASYLIAPSRWTCCSPLSSS